MLYVKQQILAFIFLFPVFGGLYSWSYSYNSFDSRLYHTGYGKTDMGRTRLDSLKSSISSSDKENDGFQFIHSFQTGGAFFSQKGGDRRRDEAEKYGMRGQGNLELAIALEKEDIETYLLLSPISIYKEDYHRQKNIEKLKDLEAIFGFKIKNAPNFILETGRGFQRLDSFGLMFAGKANFVEFKWRVGEFSPLISLTGIQYNRKEELHIKQEPEYGILKGGSLNFLYIPNIYNFRIFYYENNEKLLIAKKKTFFEEEREFSPKAYFRYAGGEIFTKDILSIFKLQAGLFYISGFKDYREKATEPVNKKGTVAGLIYAQLIMSQLPLKFGFLRSSKDREERVGRRDNAYSPILADPSIFGGRASFLLMQNINMDNPAVFTDLNTYRNSTYTNAGMQISHIEYRYKLLSYFSVAFLLNYGFSELGKGGEFIFSLYSSLPRNSLSFLLLSYTTAFIKNSESYGYFLEDKSRSKEYKRIFFSAGVSF